MSGERDVYGFEVKNDARHLSLFRDYKPLWEKEEVERTERWKKFLVGLAEDRGSAGDSSSDEEEIGLQKLEAHWQSWREVSEGADPDSEAVLQQLRSLVQAGVPLAFRGRLWKLFLGTDKKRTAGVYEKLRRRALGSRASRSKRKQHQEGAPSDILTAESPDSPGDGRAELDVKSRLLGTQSIGRVESSYLQALDKAEGQEGKQQEILLPETSLQPLQNSADAQLDLSARNAATSSLPGTLSPENGAQTPQQEDDAESGATSAPDPTASLLASRDAAGGELHMASAPSTGSSTRSRLERTSGQDWNAQIEKDLHRTFPGLPVMDSTGRRGLRHVLAAYACRNPAVGYCQGMNFVAGFLLLFMNEEDAFWCLCTIVEDLLPGYFSHAMVAPQVDQLVLKHLAEDHCPRLADHLQGQSVAFAFVSTQWFLCLFVNSLPPESCLRVWDMLFFESSAAVLFRVALALFDIYTQALMATEDALDALSVLQNIAPLSYDSSRLLDVACIGFGGVQDPDLATLRSICRLPILSHVQAAARQDVDSDSEDARSVQRSARSTSSTPTCEATSPFAAYAGADPAASQPVQPSSTAAPESALPPRALSATLPASRLKVRINKRLSGTEGSGSQPASPMQSWHATPHWPAGTASSSSQAAPALDPIVAGQPAGTSASPMAQGETSGLHPQAARSDSKPVSSSEGALPASAAGRGTILSRFHMPPLSFGRRGSAAIPSTAVRSVAELPLGGKVLPVNPNKSKAAAALFEIASHPSPLQRQPSAHQHPAALASSAEVADSEDMASENQHAEERPPGSPMMPRSPLKLREFDAKVSGPTQQLLSVLHGLQSELESAEVRQQAVQATVEQLEEQVSSVKEQLQAETSCLADDQNTVNVLRNKAVAVEEELEFVDAEVAAKQTAVTSSMSQLQLKESLLADKDTIIAQLSKQVRQAAGDGFGRMLGGFFRRPAQGSNAPQPSSEGQ